LPASLLIGLVGLAWADASQGWSAAGHQTTGAIADALLRGTPVEAQVRALVDMDLRTASLWADCAKGVAQSGAGFHYTSNPAYPECAPFETAAGQARMVDYVARNWSGCRPAPGEDPCHKQYHYTDVSIERRAYSREDMGTSDHDVVAAVQAAVRVLQDATPPAPFRIKDKTEAVLLLAHLVGDLHQPLHVGAIYLDHRGREVDPDRAPFDPRSNTRGGNLLLDHGVAFHREWDDVPVRLNAEHLGRSATARARRVPATHGPPADWPALWATQTLRLGPATFGGIAIAGEDAARHTWSITLPRGYDTARTRIQERQLILAGARLAQILSVVLP